MGLSSTHTFAKLAVTPDTYDDIKRRLLAVDYGHVIGHDGVIDMHGIGLEPDPQIQPYAFEIDDAIAEQGNESEWGLVVARNRMMHESGQETRLYIVQRDEDEFMLVILEENGVRV